jgi:hypothetical protein
MCRKMLACTVPAWPGSQDRQAQVKMRHAKRPHRTLHALLLECNLVWGVAGGILWVDTAPGMPTGAGASGRTDAAYGREK